MSWKTGREETIEMRARRIDFNVKTDLIQAGYIRVDWINLAQDRVQRQALVNTVMNLRKRQKTEKCWPAERLSASIKSPRAHSRVNLLQVKIDVSGTISVPIIMVVM
jgi:hypothetical protein